MNDSNVHQFCGGFCAISGIQILQRGEQRAIKGNNQRTRLQ